MQAEAGWFGERERERERQCVLFFSSRGACLGRVEFLRRGLEGVYVDGYFTIFISQYLHKVCIPLHSSAPLPPFPPPRLLRYPFALALPRPSVNTYQLTSSHFINLSSFPPLLSLLHSLSSILSLHQQAELFTNAQIQNPKKKWQYQQPAQSPLSFSESSAWFT